MKHVIYNPLSRRTNEVELHFGNKFSSSRNSIMLPCHEKTLFHFWIKELSRLGHNDRILAIRLQNMISGNELFLWFEEPEHISATIIWQTKRRELITFCPVDSFLHTDYLQVESSEFGRFLWQI